MESTVEIGQINIFFGWMWMILGITSGSIIGMWSFGGPMKTPNGYHNYSDLSRRLVRLAHIAMFALPMISILYGQYIDTVPLNAELKTLGSYSMIVCMIGIPTFLIGASFVHIIKYLEVIPVSAGFIALSIMGYGNYLLFIS